MHCEYFGLVLPGRSGFRNTELGSGQMRNFFSRQRLVSLIKNQTLHFCLVFIAGLLLGAIYARSLSPQKLTLMRQAVFCQSSIVGLLCCSILPFLLAAYAAYIGRRELMLAVCACKAFSYSAAGLALHRVFGTAGWLMQPMAQFTQTVTLPVFCFFILRICAGRRQKRSLIVILIITILAAGIDYFVVSPFVAGLIKN